METDAGAKKHGIAHAAQRVNGWLGTLEHVGLAVCLGALIAVGTSRAILVEVFNSPFSGADEVIRYMVFFIAMLGAALAAQRVRMIGMDLCARALSSRAQAVVRLLNTLLILFVCYLLIRGGLLARATSTGIDHEFIPRRIGLLALPIGAGLIAVHYILHATVDVCHLVTGTRQGDEP